MDRIIEALKQGKASWGQDFWHDVVDTMTEALIVVSPERRILYANQAAEELIGQSLDEVRGEVCTQAISCPQCDCECRLFREEQFDGVEVVIYQSKDQRKRIFRKSAKVLRDTAGAIIGGVEVLKDVTAEVEERQAKEDRIGLLFKEKKRHEALLSSLKEGVFSVDGALCIRDYSERMVDLLGYPQKDAVGRKLFDLLGIAHEQKPKTLPELCAQPLRIEVRCQDGGYKPVEILFRAIRFNDEEVLGLLRDLTPDPACAERNAQHSFQGIISRSPAMHKIFTLVENAAASDITVLIEGESGTGKELLARAIHRLSARNSKPFYAVNCATFTGSLLLSELFGHERGAFTGAVRQQRGKLELAEGGSLFLDEVSEIPIQHQALLLRVLEERTFERVGGHERIEMQARIVAATNRSLVEALRKGTFREDLYYRLKVVPIRVPPLRERREDVALLAQYFLSRCGQRKKTAPKEFSPKAMEIMEAYRWPGNVRELRNLIEYLCFTTEERILPEDLPAELVRCARSADGATADCLELTEGLDERGRLLAALQTVRFNKTKAAAALGIDRSTLWRKMKRLGIQA